MVTPHYGQVVRMTEIVRCPSCGSVFRDHACHMLEPWIALMLARTRARRAVRLSMARHGRKRERAARPLDDYALPD